MTYQDFLTKFQKKNSFDRYWNYFISISIISAGLYFIYLLHFTDWYEVKKVTTKSIAPIWLINTGSIFFILLGLYGFWRIPITYKVTFFESKVSIEEKNRIVNQIIKDFKLNELVNEEQYRHYRYVGRFWNSFDIYIYFDSNNFCLNAQQIEFGNNGGFIDFGTSKRVTNKIKRSIIAQL